MHVAHTLWKDAWIPHDGCAWLAGRHAQERTRPSCIFALACHNAASRTWAASRSRLRDAGVHVCLDLRSWRNAVFEIASAWPLCSLLSPPRIHLACAPRIGVAQVGAALCSLANCAGWVAVGQVVSKIVDVCLNPIQTGRAAVAGAADALAAL